jgi:hypothetical protein
MAGYYEVATRWVDVVLGRTSRSYLSNERMPISGDRIYSYGSHFEMARPIRDKRGDVSHFLFNGNTYSPTTTKHQGEVRSAIGRSGLPMVTIPNAALEAARIHLDSVQLVEVKPDWWEEREEVRFDMPGKWQYDVQVTEDRGGWRNTRTGEFRPRTKEWGESAPKQITCPGCEKEPDYGGYLRAFPDDREQGWAVCSAARREWEAHQRARHGVWEEVPHHVKNTGRKRVVSGNNGSIRWELEDWPDSPTGLAYTRTIRRHRLGGSLIRAQVNYWGRMRCTGCHGARVREPWPDRVGSDAEGPLTWREDHFHADYMYAPDWVDDGRALRPRTVTEWAWTTQCPTCRGTGWEGLNKRRWAYFLSGFDENETRPSYFFCELPAGVTPTTYDEALDALKPGAVKLAEQMQREVKRQGDIFAIPMPGLTLRQLKERGGVHIRKPHLVLEGSMLKYASAPDDDVRRYVQHLRAHGKEVRVSWSGPRPTLLGTNHEATEIVRIGRELYARGTMRHVPQNRRPDHKMLSLGNDWHLVVKNTVPIGA